MPGDQGDAQGFTERIISAAALLDAMDEEDTERKIVADAGYNQKDELESLVSAGLVPVIPTPVNRKLPDEHKAPGGHAASLSAKEAYASEKGKTLLKARAEKVERSFAHVLDSGGMRRTTLRAGWKTSTNATARQQPPSTYQYSCGRNSDMGQ